MKRLLALLLILALAGVASATSLNFQNPTDQTGITTVLTGSAGGSCSWVESGIGGNNYMTCYHDATIGSDAVFRLKNPYSTAYAAATYLGHVGTNFNDARIVLYDSTGAVLYTYSESTTENPYYPYQYEVKIVGGVAKVYKNGVVKATSTPLATNPSYIGFGSHSRGSAGSVYWDNYVYGSAENKVVLGVSESDDEMFVILSDITNPSAAGLAFGGNGTVVNSNYMVGTWSRGNSTTPLTNESVQLINYVSGTVYEQTYTGDAFSGSYSFDILTNIINNPNAPMGLYAITIPGSGAYSNQIWYKSNGASVAWSSKTYSMQDVGSIITIVAAGDYWDTSTYTYSLGVMDVYGGWHGTNTSITTQTATVSHSWNADTDPPGVYYAVLIAKSRSTGTEYIIGFDYTELSSTANFNGWVNNAQNGTVISGANVSMTQDGTVCNTLSAADGNYTCSGFSTGATWYVNATAAGFRQYLFNTTPLAAKGVLRNISMTPISPIVSEIGIGGIDSDTTYGRPISGAEVTIRNITTGESYNRTTSMTGWYLCDWGSSCVFPSQRPYDVWAYKIGYSNSTTEQAVTV
jgi:hypothetical protein